MHSQKCLAAAVAAALAKNFLSTTFGGGRDLASLPKRTRSPLRETNHLVDAFWWIKTVYNNGIRPCLPEL